MPQSHQHWLYAWIPIAGAFLWFATLWALLITWLTQGRPKYPSQDGKIAYISDVGADILKPLFIVGCVFAGVSFFLSLSIERWLRHEGRLIPDMRRRERFFSCLAIVASFIGGAGLILLSIFDTKRHPSLHRLFLLIFILGVGLSAIFTVAEYRWLSHDFVEVRKLKKAYVVKGIIAGLLIILAIAFAVTLYEAIDVGAVLEWLIAFGYTFFLLTFFYDLRMSKGVHKGELARERLIAEQRAGGNIETMRQVNAASNNTHTHTGGRRGGNASGHGSEYPNGYDGRPYAHGLHHGGRQNGRFGIGSWKRGRY